MCFPSACCGTALAVQWWPRMCQARASLMHVWCSRVIRGDGRISSTGRCTRGIFAGSLGRGGGGGVGKSRVTFSKSGAVGTTTSDRRRHRHPCGSLKKIACMCALYTAEEYVATSCSSNNPFTAALEQKETHEGKNQR